MSSMSDIVGHPRALLSLRVGFGVAVVLFWNIGFLMARHLGAPFTKPGLLTGGLCSVGVSVVAIAIAMIPAFRDGVTHPNRRHYFEPGIFRFIAFVTGGIGLGWCVTALFRAP